MVPKPLPTGIIAPIQVFFHGDTEQELDTETIGRHAVRLAKAGITGIATNGSNGEAVYLSGQERASVTSTVRHALDTAGFPHIPIMVGASDQSVTGTLRLCRDAAASGGDAALIMVPSFFKWAMDSSAIERYYQQVADGSPLPIVIYNYPAAVAGIDLDSELLERLAAHPNIIGVKFTCGNVGKLARVSRACQPISDVTPVVEGTSPFFAYAGIADFIYPSVMVGGSGAIVGAANVFPRTCVNLYRLATEGRHREAREAQQQLAQADWSLTKRAIPGFKAILQQYHGYGGVPRQPMAGLTTVDASQLCDEIRWMMEIENALPDV